MPLQARSLTGCQSDSTPLASSQPLGAALVRKRNALLQFLFTFVSNWLLFGIFFVQGVILARCLGPNGRGEFGTILFFPRDLLLYVGMMGAAEVITALAGRYRGSSGELRAAGLRLGLLTGVLTIAVAVALAAAFLIPIGKGALLGLVALTALFLPLEHIQIVVSGVDRGRGDFFRYNLNRLFFGACFPLLMAAWFGFGGSSLWPGRELEQVCLLFLLSRVVGLIPTLLPRSGHSAEEGRSLEAGERWAVDLKATHLLGSGRGYGWSMLASECFERLDVLLIVMLASFTEAGNYFVAIPAATLVTLLPNAAGLFSFNAGNNPDFRPRPSRVMLILLSALGLQALVGLGLWLVLPALISTLFGGGFETAIAFSLWLLPSCALKGYLQFVDSFLKGRGYSMLGVWTRLVAIVVMLASVWLLFPSLKLFAIPAGALIGQSLVAVVLSVFCLQVGPLGPRSTSDHEEVGRD
jgi:antigen flippase